MITLYGIANCNTMKKARTWLDEHNIEYRFHDYKKQGAPEQELKAWIEELGWEALLNRKGMTWRHLDDDQKQDLNADKALQIMLEKPSIIKRPVLDAGEKRLVGFAEQVYAEHFE